MVSGVNTATRGLFAEGVVQGHTRCRLDLLSRRAREHFTLRADPQHLGRRVGDRLCGPARQLWHLSCECATQSPECGK